MRITKPRVLHGFRMVREGSSGTIYHTQVKLGNPQDVVNVLAPLYEHEDVEVFGFIALDAKHRMLGGPIVVTRGTLTSTLVTPREIFCAALTLHEGGPAALILFHNHPSGDPTPSRDDREVTDQMVAAGRMMDIPVFDHVIIGRGQYMSFADAGLL